MSTESLSSPQQILEPSASTVAAQQVGAPQESGVKVGATEKLDEVENIDFLLEEIENKIAPLALA